MKKFLLYGFATVVTLIVAYEAALFFALDMDPNYFEIDNINPEN